jgi:hypothetical protein
MNIRVTIYKDLKDLWKSNKTRSNVKTFYKAVNFTLTKKRGNETSLRELSLSLQYSSV